MKTDLHIHTVLSDGGCTPEQVFSYARSAGIGCLSITDHDQIGDFNSYSALAEQFGVRVIPGTEISAFDSRRKRRVHILAYGNPSGADVLRNICDNICRNRRETGEEMARLVAEKYPITLRDVETTSSRSNSIFKQHIMQALMQAGFSTEMYGTLWQELFHNVHGSCLRNCAQPDVWEVLRAVREAGYFCVMAHPFTYDSMEVLGELVQAGLLDGVEVWQSKTTTEQEAFLLNFAQEHRLVPTGGSDFHGMFASRVAPLGSGLTPDESVEKIFEKIC